MSELRHGGVQVGGIRSPLIEAGPADAREAVVFMHGNPGSSSDWMALVQAAGDYGRALAIDMPGFGHSVAPPEFPCDVGSYAAHLDGALKQLGVEQVHLVLHDFGGPFGLLWGMQHPQAWKSVVLINIGVMPGYKWHSMAKRWRTPVVGEVVQAWIPRWGWRRTMQKSGPRGLPPAFVDKMYDEYDRNTRRTVLKLYRATPDPGEAAAEVGAAIAELHKPALVVWGAADPYLGVEYAERQREFFDVQDTLVLEQSSHWPFQDDPEPVERAVVPFLRQQLSRSMAA
jgi:pimeloyl-ACP methyl ester carboxylesterase